MRYLTEFSFFIFAVLVAVSCTSGMPYKDHSELQQKKYDERLQKQLREEILEKTKKYKVNCLNYRAGNCPKPCVEHCLSDCDDELCPAVCDDHLEGSCDFPGF